MTDGVEYMHVTSACCPVGGLLLMKGIAPQQVALDYLSN